MNETSIEEKENEVKSLDIQSVSKIDQFCERVEIFEECKKIHEEFENRFVLENEQVAQYLVDNYRQCANLIRVLTHEQFGRRNLILLRRLWLSMRKNEEFARWFFENVVPYHTLFELSDVERDYFRANLKKKTKDALWEKIYKTI